MTSALVPGMVLASDVITSIGQVLLVKGTTLTDADITRLDFYSVLSVTIEQDEHTPPAPTVPVAQQESESYLEKIKRSQEFQEYKISFAKNSRKFEDECMKMLKNGGAFPAENMLGMVEEMMDKAKEVCGVFDMLHNLRTFDDELFAHSINVALICRTMAGWFGLNREDTDILVICGLLHDVGKIKIPTEILRKPAKLSDEEFEIMKNHTVEGYNIVSKMEGLDDHVRNAVLMHHERCDGSGYPLRIIGDRIDEFAKMVAIADVYEAITAPRVYRKALCPFDAIRIFEEEGMQKYDPRYLLPFLDNVINTYIQNKVVLSNGEQGMVVMVNRNALSRPLVRTENNVYDLRKRKDLRILAIG